MYNFVFLNYISEGIEWHSISQIKYSYTIEIIVKIMESTLDNSPEIKNYKAVCCEYRTHNCIHIFEKLIILNF